MVEEPIVQLSPDSLSGGIDTDDEAAPIDGATWYTATDEDAALVYEFEPGALADATHLTTDLLLDGEHLAKFHLRLAEGADGRTFRLTYGALNQCEARIRMPLSATNQNRWKYEREGAWLKPLAGGDRVDLGRVDRLEIAVVRKSERPVRWCQTPVVATADEPSRLSDPLLPEGPLLDELGQSTIHEWEGKTDGEAELVDRLETQSEASDAPELPDSFSEWGGWVEREFEGTGFFDVRHDGDRWWLVDPDGHPFWSAGLDCVRSSIDASYEGLEDALTWFPDDERFESAVGERAGEPSVNYLAANFIRTFGPDEWYDRWAEISLAKLREFGFNTVGNWSEWEIASEAGVPYVRPLTLEFPGTPDVYRDFPDVYHESFPDSAAEFASQLEETVGDPALIGYFLGNEPTWGFAEETPAAGMLYTTESCATRQELADTLREKYGDDEALADAWGMDVTLDDVAGGRWSDPLTESARADLEAFSSTMVDRLYRVVSEACREVDPDHLNLGTRYAYVPGDWALEGMRHVDVFSINCYQERVPDEYAEISERLDVPLMIGEWHFGALDVGLPASGIRRVRDQAARGDAYRVYFENAAAKPWCVGVHYFTQYDQSALGRFDGENYNIGFMDVCNRTYEPLADAARTSHARLYDVASGVTEPYDDEPEYCSQLF